MNRIIILLIVLSVYACQCNNGDGTVSMQVDEAGNAIAKKNLLEGVNIPQVLAQMDDILPEMCDLLTVEEIAATLGLEPGQISIKNSTPGGDNPDHRTCFFKWSDPDFPNTGIMMQALRNPMVDEFPEYITVYMESKRQNGENKLGDDFVHRFKELDGMADEGLYNADIGKYLWRFSDQVIFQLAFNTIHEQEEQFDIAMKLGSKMITNYMGVD